MFILVTLCLSKTGVIKSDTLLDHLWKFAICAPLLLVCVQAVAVDSSVTWNVASWFLIHQSPSEIHSASPQFEQKPTVQIQEAFQRHPSEQSSEVTNSDENFAHENSILPLLGSASKSEILSDSPSQRPLAASSERESEFSEEEVHESKTTSMLDETLKQTEAATESISPAASNLRVSNRFARSFRIDHTLRTFVLLLPILFFGCITKLLIQFWRVSNKLKGCEETQSALVLSLLEQFQNKLNCHRKVKVLEAKSQIEPAACGVWNWKIVIPENLEQKLCAKEIEAILAHELAHLQRHDPAFSIVMQAVRGCLFWQPLNFIAIRNWRMAAERCCDANAVRSGVDQFTLARCLTNVAAWKMSPVPTFGVGASTSLLTGRIERLVGNSISVDRWSKGWRRQLRRGLLLSVFISAVFLSPRFSWTVEKTEHFVPKPVENSEKSDNSSVHTDLFLGPNSSSSREPSRHRSVETHSDEAVLAQEIQLLTNDLSYALKLLDDQEEDPEIRVTISSIQKQLNRLRSHHSEIEQFGKLAGGESQENAFPLTSSLPPHPAGEKE